jgi:hypothetical protein
LLTISIKVNIPATVESQLVQGTEDEEEDSRLVELVLWRRLGRRRRRRLSGSDQKSNLGINALLSARYLAGAFVLTFSEGLVEPPHIS